MCGPNSCAMQEREAGEPGAQGLERFRMGVGGRVRRAERSQGSVSGTCNAETTWWPVSDLLC